MAQRPGLAAPVAPVNPNYTAHMGKDRFDNCKAKSLIYGGEERTPTPTKSGTKSRPGAGITAETPYATYDGASEAKYPNNAEFHRKIKNKDVQEKVGGDRGFDPKVYAANRQANYRNQMESKRRNFVGSGDILAFQAGQDAEGDPDQHQEH